MFSRITLSIGLLLSAAISHAAEQRIDLDHYPEVTQYLEVPAYSGSVTYEDHGLMFSCGSTLSAKLVLARPLRELTIRAIGSSRVQFRTNHGGSGIDRLEL